MLTFALLATVVFAVTLAATLWWPAPAAAVVAPDALIDDVDSLLPQTQCGQCTFGGCRPYAAALVRGEADINQCPPGGHATAARLASLLGRPTKPVDPRFGDVAAPVVIAWIDETACIGCARCLPACPVDAIVGAQRYTHTVIAAECTGCRLCLPPCPVDCIELRPVAAPSPVLGPAGSVPSC